ncbi:MAG: hypothetical protein FJZ01_19900 [Candidatus Sericytochromatia bacterium]|nr:hypothetical protein [Candidatus Tanganyikabacteria bacterium]
MAELREPVLRHNLVMARDLGVAPTEDRPTIAVASGDMVHWGSIWGGFMVAVAVGLVLAALPIALGVRPAATPTWWGLTLAVIGGLVATYAGALCTGYLSGVYNRICAGFNGLVLGCLLVAGTAVAAISGAASAAMAGLFPLTRFVTPNTVTPEAMGSAWGFIIAAILVVAVGYSGALQGEQLREAQIDREHGIGR